MSTENYRIAVAENCGFCFGVRRAVEMVYDLRRKTDKKIYVIGELIHNDIFIKRLEQDGIFRIESGDIPSLAAERDNVILVIRTHGVTRELTEELKQGGFEVIDATCPFVKRIHTIVEENSADCDCTVIVGDKNHPEVIGIASYARSDAKICSDEKECFEFVNDRRRKPSQNVLLVSQTTGNHEKYVNCQKVLKKVYTNAKIFDTICSVTENRQNEIRRIAAEADVMFVIGGAKSSNTRKLYEIALASCEHTYLLARAKDIPAAALAEQYSARIFADGRIFTVGITAGASTPDDIIEEVKVRIEDILEHPEHFGTDEKQSDGHIHD